MGPTHEEVITDLVRNEIQSYKQMPINFYQIQTKFRDEIRPRFGVIRAKEFIMKDGYSFDLTQEKAFQAYDRMFEAYLKAPNSSGDDEFGASVCVSGDTIVVGAPGEDGKRNLVIKSLLLGIYLHKCSVLAQFQR